MATILLVSKEVLEGDRIADELERRGHDVMLCPGPQPPRFICPGARGARCPLASATDAVVLDGWLASDEARQGIPFWRLAMYYRGQDIPVVALVGPEAFPGPVLDDQLVAVPRGSEPVAIADAVDDLMLGKRLSDWASAF